MARSVRSRKLDTRSARAKLVAQKSPYWTRLSRGCALGYRKSSTGGVWIAKLVRGLFRKEAVVGPADDILDADGVLALSFDQAQERARAVLSGWAADADGRPSVGFSLSYTVADAVQDYQSWYAHHRKASTNLRITAAAHILPSLGSKRLVELTSSDIEQWHLALASHPARVRGSAGMTARRNGSMEEETIRKRRVTANNILAVLKAVLNRAWRAGKISSDTAWRMVKPFQGVNSAVVRYLSVDECSRIVDACLPEFRPLVKAAILTGCRYGELASLRIADYDVAAGTLAIRLSKTGKARHVFLSEEGQMFFRGEVTGRPSGELVFRRSDGRPWGKSHQHRMMREACRRASIEPSVSFHVLRHTHASLLAMAGVPIPVIAKQLGHADTRITERHYAHLSSNYVADAIRGGFPKLGIVPRHIPE